ncbi:MAG: class I mannose-6-phosphate isomerase [Kiritimatiellia bacterium]|jgi:mannose-6-phosphate isomerase|nr:class I mannose-6-phosphate isomerase [Kiritimatiellia bacterium]MDP6848676.1 class I mannose-6-phosphate isomerase [Kiritimatiellia bacterium]
MANIPYPILFDHVYKDYIWGGSSIAGTYGRDDTPEICAESWEVSDRPEGMSIVSNGPLAGRTLHDIVQDWGVDLLGSSVTSPVFPLLIKIIDAKKRLSLQVHPNDETALLYGGEAKTEAWAVLDTEKGSGLYAGFEKAPTPGAFRKAVEDETVEDMLNFIPVEKGVAIYIPGGRLHAIGEGCLLLEVQQNSNTTYRVYDWGRLGHDGKPRELHMEQALQVIDWEGEPGEASEPKMLLRKGKNTLWELIDSPFFRMWRRDVNDPQTVKQDGLSFAVLFAASGRLTVEIAGCSESIAAGTSCLVPAIADNYTITPEEPDSSVIEIRVPPEGTGI